MLVKIGSVVEAVEDAGEVGDESALVALPELLEPREEPWPLLELSEEPLEELKPENNDLKQARSRVNVSVDELRSEAEEVRSMGLLPV